MGESPQVFLKTQDWHLEKSGLQQYPRAQESHCYLGSPWKGEVQVLYVSRQPEGSWQINSHYKKRSKERGGETLDDALGIREN